jgi:DNA invertase Pin-like site-specific DNA recombinase
VKKCFVYLRVSGKSQVDGDGFDRQLAAVRSYAKSNSIRITKVFREEGVSGTKDMANRPAFSEMLEALHSNGVRLVLVERLDRLARDLMIQESIIADLKRSGFEIVSVTEPDLCSDDPSRKLMRQVLGAFAEYEKDVLVLKLRGAKQRLKAKTGVAHEGAKPFGYYEGEAAVLEKMKALRSSGVAYDKIAAILNREGIKPRRGERWHPFTVSKIMTKHGVVKGERVDG